MPADSKNTTIKLTVNNLPHFPAKMAKQFNAKHPQVLNIRAVPVRSAQIDLSCAS